MPFHFRERPNSRSGDKESQVRRYVATGSIDEVGIRLQAYALTPSAIITAEGFLYRQNIVTDDVQDTIAYLSVTYGKRQFEEGTWTWDFDGTGGSINVKASKASIAKYPNDAKDSNQLIGANADEVAGADIVIPTAKITVGYSHPQGVFSLDYAFAVSALTGTVNSTTMLTRPAGEILFLGPRGSDGTAAAASVQYSFAYSPNLQGLVVGAINGIAKDGWDVSWIKWTDDDADDKPGKKEKAVYIERVYERVDLASLLGFGG